MRAMQQVALTGAATFRPAAREWRRRFQRSLLISCSPFFFRSLSTCGEGCAAHTCVPHPAMATAAAGCDPFSHHPATARTARRRPSLSSPPLSVRTGFCFLSLPISVSAMDPLAKAQEQHSRMHAELLAKGRAIAALESKLAEATAAAAEAERRVAAEAKRSAAALQERDVQMAARIAELEAREAELDAAEDALAAAQESVSAEKSAAAQSVEEATARALEAEEKALAMSRERDAALAANATELHQYHEQLISLSRNHLDQQNEDIGRLAKLKQEKEVRIQTPTTGARTNIDRTLAEHSAP